MLPVLFRIGPVEVPAFGVALAIGILLGAVYFLKQFPDDWTERLSGLLIYAVLAGLAGSRLNYILEHTDEITSYADLVAMLISRSGLTIYGGLIAGALVAFWYSRRNELPSLRILDAGAGAICIGYFWGRLGCQLAGDGDYGTPSNLPWAMAYPNGTIPTFVPVHPTPLYEMALYASLFLFLTRLKKCGLPEGKLFYGFMILAGTERFAIEFIRLNPPIFLRLTEAQLVSLAVIAAGMFFIFRAQTSLRVRGSET